MSDEDFTEAQAKGAKKEATKKIQGKGKGGRQMRQSRREPQWRRCDSVESDCCTRNVVESG